MFDGHVFGRFDFQEPVTSGKIANLDLEVDQSLEKSGRRSLGAIDNSPAAGVPSARRAQRPITREG